MKFGKVDDPSQVDFTIPSTPQETIDVLGRHRTDDPFEVSVGCAKWNRKDLKGFYPRGTKDELDYYSRQFNAIELNATFYNSPSKNQVEIWKNKTPESIKIFRKLPQSISHYSRLLNTDEKVRGCVGATVLFEAWLGMGCLELSDHCWPTDCDRLES